MFSFIYVMTMVLTISHIQSRKFYRLSIDNLILLLFLVSRAADCSVNEKYVECARDISCQPTCDKPQGTACPRACGITSCECQDGYIRVSKDNQTCIAIGNCKQCKDKILFGLFITEYSKFLVCDENEQYDACANPCQPSCQEPDRQPCPTSTCSKGCVCREGYLRASNNVNSACIKCDIINTF